jgi:hypothetical protein
MQRSSRKIYQNYELKNHLLNEENGPEARILRLCGLLYQLIDWTNFKLVSCVNRMETRKVARLELQKELEWQRLRSFNVDPLHKFLQIRGFFRCLYFEVGLKLIVFSLNKKRRQNNTKIFIFLKILIIPGLPTNLLILGKSASEKSTN